jgi:hypothetical protein
MAEPSADAPPAMSDAQAETLRGVVSSLRRCLPDPSARDVHDAIAEHDVEMAAWATAGRVKKLCTQMNKELRRSPATRVGDEPDETDGPILTETLRRWPSTQSPIFLHLAARGDSRVFFPHEHHRLTPGEDETSVSVGLAFRRSLADAARLHDEHVSVWRLVAPAVDFRSAAADGDESSSSTSSRDDPVELVIVCKAARVFSRNKKHDPKKSDTKAPDDHSETVQAPLPDSARCVFEVLFLLGDATKNAHKRALEKPLAENAGAIGEIRLTRGSREVWLNHLTRNRHYEDKYCGAFDATQWWDETVGVFSSPETTTARRISGDQTRPTVTTHTWESSYVVTPNAEWFR